MAHGIELVAAGGPHVGRLAIARRYDATKSVADAFSRSFVLYSDDHGALPSPHRHRHAGRACGL